MIGKREDGRSSFLDADQWISLFLAPAQSFHHSDDTQPFFLAAPIIIWTHVGNLFGSATKFISKYEFQDSDTSPDVNLGMAAPTRGLLPSEEPWTSFFRCAVNCKKLSGEFHRGLKHVTKNTVCDLVYTDLPILSEFFFRNYSW